MVVGTPRFGWVIGRWSHQIAAWNYLGPWMSIRGREMPDD